MLCFRTFDYIVTKSDPLPFTSWSDSCTSSLQSDLTGFKPWPSASDKLTQTLHYLTDHLLCEHFYEIILYLDREDTLKKSYEEQMRTLKFELETMKSDYQTKITEFTERSNQHDVSSTMLKSLKEKHENELVLLKEVCKS